MQSMMIIPQSVPQYDVTAHEVIKNRHNNALLTSLGSWIILSSQIVVSRSMRGLSIIVCSLIGGPQSTRCLAHRSVFYFPSYTSISYCIYRWPSSVHQRCVSELYVEVCWAKLSDFKVIEAKTNSELVFAIVQSVTVITLLAAHHDFA